MMIIPVWCFTNVERKSPVRHRAIPPVCGSELLLMDTRSQRAGEEYGIVERTLDLEERGLGLSPGSLPAW